MPSLIEIVMTVCSVANPSLCEQRNIQFASEGSLRTCMLSAPPYIAQYMGNHPQWTVSRWACQFPGGDKKNG